jgi:predicted MPP superfamily phosphohydrolase
MTGGSLAARPFPRERRSSRSRRSLELILDGFFRPGHWAAAFTYHTGLQGVLRRVETAVSVSARAASAPVLRLAFASDFHAGPTTDPKRLEEACTALAELAPDVLLLGGDFVSVRAAYIDQVASRLADIHPPLGKFAVLGNHDLRANYPLIVDALEKAGVEMLTNRHVRLPAPFDDIGLYGLDDAIFGRPDAGALDGATGTKIVLMHSPEGLRTIGDRDFDLALCGHTHGGQIAWPNGRPLLIPGGPLNRLYASGVFSLGHRKLLVSRGVGCSTLPVRLFAQPEVHLVVMTGMGA